MKTNKNFETMDIQYQHRFIKLKISIFIVFFTKSVQV